MLLQLRTSKIDHIWLEYDHILPFTDHRSILAFSYEAQSVLGDPKLSMTSQFPQKS